MTPTLSSKRMTVPKVPRRAEPVIRLVEAGGAEAGSLSSEAEDAARAVADLDGRSSTLAGLAFAVRAAGNGGSAGRLFAEARSLARSINESGPQRRESTNSPNGSSVRSATNGCGGGRSRGSRA
jgi:hypothetical protein